MMSGIRGKNTKPELLLRSGLHRKGFRFRLHYGQLPGKPDLVFPKYRAIILVNGCFWHGHNCHLFKWPTSREEFWKEKISSNMIRDARNLADYKTQDWRTLIVWECALKGKGQRDLNEVIDYAANWLLNETGDAELEGGR